MIFKIGLFTAFTQSYKIQGKVIVAHSELQMSGASISVKNSEPRTITDSNGNFSLDAPKNSTIPVSFVGYNGVEILTQKMFCTVQ